MSGRFTNKKKKKHVYVYEVFIIFFFKLRIYVQGAGPAWTFSTHTNELGISWHFSLVWPFFFFKFFYLL